MCWDDINLEKGVWEIPKEKMKMKVDFVCPLSKQAIPILKKIESFSKHRSRFVFLSPYKNDRGVSYATPSDTLNKLGYQNKQTGQNDVSLVFRKKFDNDVIRMVSLRIMKKRFYL